MRLLLVLSLATFVLLATSGAASAIWFNSCIDKDACQCINDDVIRCACPKNHTLVRIKPFHLLQRKNLVAFTNCDEVDIDQLAMSTNPPASLDFTNITKLILRPSSFHQVHDMDSILIVNTSLDEIGRDTFLAASHITRIELRNVTIGQIHPGAFRSLSEVDTFLIQDSTIDTIHEHAFNDTYNFRKFVFINTFIREMRPYALTLRNVNEFVMLNTTVLTFGNRSLTLVNASHVLVDSCHVRSMEGSALTTLLTNEVEVSRNVFERLAADAWNGVTDATTLTFVDNHVWRADAGSLTVLLREKVNSVVRNNFVSCDEHLCWLFDDPDAEETVPRKGATTFFDRNYCLNGTSSDGVRSASAKTLAMFSSLADDEDVCRPEYTSGAGSVTHGEFNNLTVVNDAATSVRDVTFLAFVVHSGLYLIVAKAFF